MPGEHVNEHKEDPAKRNERRFYRPEDDLVPKIEWACVCGERHSDIPDYAPWKQPSAREIVERATTVLGQAVAEQSHLKGTCWCGQTHVQAGDTVRYKGSE